MKTLFIIVALFVSVSSFAQKVQIIEEELEERPFGMKYDGGMEPSCCYELESNMDVNLPSMEEIKKSSVLENVWNQIQENEKKKETSFLIRNDVDDEAFLIKNYVDDEA